MKKQIVSGLVVLLALGTGYAKTTKATKISKKSSTFKVAQNTTANSVAAGESSAKLPTTAPSPLGARFYLQNEVGVNNAGEGEFRDSSGLGFGQLSYQISENLSVFGRQYWTYETTKAGGYDYNGKIDNLHFELDNSKFTSLGSYDVLGGVRVVLPISESATDVGRYEMRLLANTTIPFAQGVSMDLTLNPRFYTYTIRADGQTAIRLYNEAELDIKIADPLIFKTLVTHEAYYNRAGIKTSNEQQASADRFYTSDATVNSMAEAQIKAGGSNPRAIDNIVTLTAGFDIKPVKGFTLTPTIYQAINLNDAAEDDSYDAWSTDRRTVSLELDARF